MRVDGLCGLNKYAKNSNMVLPKPACYETMVELALLLTKNIPFVRIDFYVIDNHPYFGEITFYPNGGFGAFKPYFWNEKLEAMINISSLQ